MNAEREHIISILEKTDYKIAKAGETVIPEFLKGFAAFQKVVPDLPCGKAVIYGGD